MAHLMNLTVQVPPGSTLSDDGRILCISGPAWNEALLVVTFFATNYFAHAATIKSTPGDTTTITVCNIVLALVFPMSGLMRALNAIARLARFGGSEIENACRAGALCMVVRSPEWMPAKGETVRATVVDGRPEETSDVENEEQGLVNETDAKLIIYLPQYAREDSSRWAYFDTVGSRAVVDPDLTRIHGSYILPRGYNFAVVPRDTIFTSLSSVLASHVVPGDLSSGYSVAKAMLSLVQALAAALTLTQHKSGLIDRWGYASYHLTVLPYLAMTIVNFISNALTPDYPCIYMVRTEVMKEAEDHGGEFVGTVARVRDAQAIDAMSNEELSAWEGLKTEHLQRAIEFLALRDPLMAFALVEMQHRRRSTLTNTDLTSLGACESTDDDDGPSVVRLVAGTSKYNIRQVASPTTVRWQMPMMRVLQKAMKQSLGGSQVLIVLAFQQRLQEIADHTRQGLHDEYPRPRSRATWAKLPLIAVGRILKSLFKPHARPREPSRLSSVYARTHREIESRFPGFAKTRVGQVCVPAMAVVMLLWRTMGLNDALEPPPEEQESIAIYVPCCMPFRRAKQPGRGVHSRSTGALFELGIGLLLLSIVVAAIAWQSKWFEPGESSITLRVIMLVWLCEGTIGLLLPILSLKELMLVFFFLPLYAILTRPGFRPSLGMGMGAYVPPHMIIGLIPWGILVAPVWGFVLVGQMLVEWGSCVTLY